MDTAETNKQKFPNSVPRISAVNACREGNFASKTKKTYGKVELKKESYTRRS